MDSEKMENSCNFLTDGKSLQARCWAIAWKSKDVESKRLYAYKKSISKGSAGAVAKSHRLSFALSVSLAPSR